MSRPAPGASGPGAALRAALQSSGSTPALQSLGATANDAQSKAASLKQIAEQAGQSMTDDTPANAVANGAADIKAGFLSAQPINSPCVTCAAARGEAAAQATAADGPAAKAAAADAFLVAKGIQSAALRQQLLGAGLKTELLDPDVTPATLLRFDKLFADTIAAGKSFSGRLGNVDTRVATINKAAELETKGLTVTFEHMVPVGNGKARFVDLAGISATPPPPSEFVQFVKADANGVVLRPDELVAAKQIENALSLPPKTVQLINTKR